MYAYDIRVIIMERVGKKKKNPIEIEPTVLRTKNAHTHSIYWYGYAARLFCAFERNVRKATASD